MKAPRLCRMNRATLKIARTMSFYINLIALKVDTLISQGYQLCKQEHRNGFPKHNHKMLDRQISFESDGLNFLSVYPFI